MKKTSIILLCLILIFSVVSCNKNKTENIPTTTETTAEVKASVAETTTTPTIENNEVVTDNSENYYNLTINNMQITATLNEGKLVLDFPVNVSNDEIEKGIDFIVDKLNANKTDFSYKIISPSQVELTYPKEYSNQSIINILNQYSKTYNLSSQELFTKEYQDFEFYLGDVHVTGKVNDHEVIFNYDSEMFDNYLEEQLVKIASTAEYNVSDLSYSVSKGQLSFKYSENIDPNKAIDAFFKEIFSFDL